MITLENKTLWFDGDSSYSIKQLEDRLLSGLPITEHMFIDNVTDDVKKYNRYCVTDSNKNKKLNVKGSENIPEPQWNIPSEFMSINIKDYIEQSLVNEFNKPKNIKFTDDDKSDRINRVLLEYKLFKKHHMIDLLKVIRYILIRFKESNSMWGTGRGSSCSSYILYLMGLHSVDSVKYDINVQEFFKDKVEA